jgi:hypothetical protein
MLIEAEASVDIPYHSEAPSMVGLQRAAALPAYNDHRDGCPTWSACQRASRRWLPCGIPHIPAILFEKEGAYTGGPISSGNRCSVTSPFGNQMRFFSSNVSYSGNSAFSSIVTINVSDGYFT